jgi:hypothetical protein
MLKTKIMDLWTFLTKPLFEKKVDRQLGEPIAGPVPTPPPVNQLTPVAKPRAPKATALTVPPPDTQTTLPVITDFLKAEIHLETIGFFTPIKNRATIKRTSKTITIRDQHQGKPVEATVRILPSAEYGFPVTADLDKYRAFQKILTGYAKEQGSIPQHITFTSAQLIKLMGKGSRRGGEHYQDIEDWLRRMQATNIGSEAAIYHAGTKEWIKAQVNVFQGFVLYGKELEGGAIADRHHIWLSDWYWANVNAFNKSEPIDYNLYKTLTKPIAKALIGLFKQGFYAGGGTFHKRYDDLCTLLGITPFQSLARIRQQLDDSHRELQKTRFLKTWTYAKSSDQTTFVITWTAGAKYYQEQAAQKREQQRLTQSVAKAISPAPPRPDHHPLVAQLTAAGIGQATAQEIATNVDPTTITRWLTIKPYLRAKDPAAYLAHALTKGIPVPEYASKAHQKAKEHQRQQKLDQARAAQERAQQRHQAQHHADLMAYYATLPPATQAALNAQALANLTPFCRQQATRLTSQGRNPLDSPIVRADFEEQRDQLLEQHQKTNQAPVKSAT